VKAEARTASLQSITGVDRLIHEPARMVIVTILYAAAGADFLYLLHETGLTKGNLSAHLSKLEEAGYVKIDKIFRGKVPQTLLSLTPAGRAAFESYREHLKQIVDSISKEYEE
jgi:DNA-binding MarR family transcriptional regulator